MKFFPSTIIYDENSLFMLEKGIMGCYYQKFKLIVINSKSPYKAMVWVHELCHWAIHTFHFPQICHSILDKIQSEINSVLISDQQRKEFHNVPVHTCGIPIKNIKELNGR